MIGFSRFARFVNLWMKLKRKLLHRDPVEDVIEDDFPIEDQVEEYEDEEIDAEIRGVGDEQDDDVLEQYFDVQDLVDEDVEDEDDDAFEDLDDEDIEDEDDDVFEDLEDGSDVDDPEPEDHPLMVYEVSDQPDLIQQIIETGKPNLVRIRTDEAQGCYDVYQIVSYCTDENIKYVLARGSVREVDSVEEVMRINDNNIHFVISGPDAHAIKVFCDTLGLSYEEY